MTPRYGIDTSVLVRLLTGLPPDAFSHCAQELERLAKRGAEVYASNQVIGEAYVAVQHHYGVTKSDARAALLDVLRSGLVSPLNGRAIIDALSARGQPGLFDRLIANDYQRAGLEVLTMDVQMAGLPNARRL